MKYEKPTVTDLPSYEELRARVDAAERELKDYRLAAGAEAQHADEEQAARRAAEREVERLREALEQIANGCPAPEIRARNALAASREDQP